MTSSPAAPITMPTEAEPGARVDDPADRSTWAYPALTSYRLYDYPTPALLPRVTPADPADWRPAPGRGLRRFAEQTASLRQAGLIYVHVPVCPVRCTFCPFYKELDRSLLDPFVTRVGEEIDLHAGTGVAAGERFGAVYFGGGTPTELGPEQLAAILDRLRDRFDVAPDAEITIEGVASQMRGHLGAYAEMGVRRVAFGIQSLDPAVRRVLGRAWDDVDAYRTVVDEALAHGVVPNVELMMGCPQQPEESVLADIETVASWGVGSLELGTYVPSAGTVLFDRSRDDPAMEPLCGPPLLRLRQRAFARLRQLGFRAGRAESFLLADPHLCEPSSPEAVGNGLHTQLSFGPSATGFVHGAMYRNVPDVHRWAAAVEAGKLPFGFGRRLDGRAARHRAFLLAIGSFFVPDALVTTRRQRHLVRRWLDDGLVERADRGCTVTDRGALWENEMQMEALPMSEGVRGLPMLGSLAHQREVVRRRSPLGRELPLQATVGSATPRLQRLGYRATLALGNRIPGVRSRSVGFLGPIEPARPTDHRSEHRPGRQSDRRPIRRSVRPPDPGCRPEHRPGRPTRRR